MSTTLTATIEHVTHTTSKATVRTHTCLVDRGAAKGGLDLGPMGGEYLLVALGGCFTSHLLASIRAREAAVTGVRVTVEGTMDGAPERFTSFAVNVSAECDDQALVRKLITMAGRACQVVNTLRLVAPVSITYAGQSIDVGEVAATR